MNQRLKKPCNDCPFRRKAAAGWLGSGTPEHFVSAALSDFYGGMPSNEDAPGEPCHQTVDYEDPDWADKLDAVEMCVGALVFYRNVDEFKMPRCPVRGPLIMAVEPDHETVFSTEEEFIDHHSNAPAKSWRLNERRSA